MSGLSPQVYESAQAGIPITTQQAVKQAEAAKPAPVGGGK